MTTKTTDPKNKGEKTNENSEDLIDDLELDTDDENKNKTEEAIELSKTKVELLQRLLAEQKENLDKITNLLTGVMSNEEARISIGQLSEVSLPDIPGESEGQIVEGVFDGESMIGPDGKQYSVPANYASKSKLVEGDILKLAITQNGTFVYKQIGPIDRSRVVGRLEQGSSGNFTVIADDKSWRVLTASVTYFKGQDGDEVIILVPKVGQSKWAAVENIVKN